MIGDLAQQIVWLGHDSFRIDASQTIYFDPYQITAGPPADIICITHEHFDHCSPEDVKKIQTEQTVIVTENKSASKLSGDIRIVRPGETLDLKGVTVESVPAYNTDKNFHPQTNAWLGFIVTIDGVRLYHAGDSDFIPEMKAIQADIALLPVSGTYVMTAKQAVQAALAINPRLAIPMHYGSIVGSDQDAQQFQQALKGKIEVLILDKKANK